MEPWADNLYTNSFLDSVPSSFSNIDDIKSFLYLNIMRLMMFREKKKKKKSSLNLSFWRSLAQVYARICDTIFPWNKNLEYVLVLHHLVRNNKLFSYRIWFDWFHDLFLNIVYDSGSAGLLQENRETR